MTSPAPLYSAPGRRLDGRAAWIEAADGTRLRTAWFDSLGLQRRGTVLLSCGRAEPIEKYAETIGELQRRGFAILAHDWRGQGLSARFDRVRRGPDGVPYGHGRGWRRFVSDLSRVLDAYADRLLQPCIGLGHSMGGGLTLLAMAEEARLDAAILSAPMLGLRLGGRPVSLVRTVTAAMTFFGQAGKPTPPRRDAGEVVALDGDALTHDRARWSAFRALLQRAPEMALGEPTWGWLQFAFALEARLRAPGVLERIEAPVTIVAAERDLLVPGAPQRSAAARLPNGRYVEVEGAFHEILMETDARRAVFWRAFDDLAEQVAP